MTTEVVALERRGGQIKLSYESGNRSSKEYVFTVIPGRELKRLLSASFTKMSGTFLKKVFSRNGGLGYGCLKQNSCNMGS